MSGVVTGIGAGLAAGAAGIGTAGAIGIGATAGLAGAVTSHKASKAQKEALNAQKDASAAQLAFAQQQYEDWQSIFGPIEQHLSHYYNTLHPDTIEALGISKIEKAYNEGLKQLDRQIAQRGLSNSGVEAQGLTQLDQAKAADKATLRMQAPQIVANEKMKFLGLGLGNQNALSANVLNSYSNLQNIATNQLNQANLAKSQALNGIGSLVGNAISLFKTTNTLKSSPTTYIL